MLGARRGELYSTREGDYESQKGREKGRDPLFRCRMGEGGHRQEKQAFYLKITKGENQVTQSAGRH